MALNRFVLNPGSPKGPLLYLTRNIRIFINLKKKHKKLFTDFHCQLHNIQGNVWHQDTQNLTSTRLPNLYLQRLPFSFPKLQTQRAFPNPPVFFPLPMFLFLVSPLSRLFSISSQLLCNPPNYGNHIIYHPI